MQFGLLEHRGFGSKFIPQIDIMLKKVTPDLESPGCIFLGGPGPDDLKNDL
jgi:hypothetical protein